MNKPATTNGKRGLFKPLLKDFFDIDPFFAGSWLQKMESGIPAVNITEDEKNYWIEVIAPGFKKDDFKISVDENILTISAELSVESDKQEQEYTRREYSFNSFTRSFRLPENVKEDAIIAGYHDGILKLTIPKTGSDVKVLKQIPIS